MEKPAGFTVDDKVIRYLHGRIDQRAYQVGWLEQTMRSAINALRDAKRFNEWHQVDAVIDAMTKGLQEAQGEAEKFAEKSDKLHQAPANQTPA